MTRKRIRHFPQSAASKRSTRIEVSTGATTTWAALTGTTIARASAEAQSGLSRWSWLAVALILSVWVVTACTIASRSHTVMGYQANSTLPAGYEPLAINNTALSFLAVLVTVWLFLVLRVTRSAFRSFNLSKPIKSNIFRSHIGLLLACLPFLPWLSRLAFGDNFFQPSIVEPIWFSFFTGFAACRLLWHEEVEVQITQANAVAGAARGSGLGWLIISSACLLAATWWYLQTRWYYDNFLLGFNDFGHFTQRIANTSAGRGFLLESPVLPPFWDHFNPGLLLLVPLWAGWHSVDLIFVLQAGCLAMGGWLVWRLARALGAGRPASIVWGLAWLAHPALGQMNLAYTYGWHPVSIAIPLLLAAMLHLIKRRYIIALVATVLAATMEENILVVVCLFAVARAVRFFASQRLGFNRSSIIDGGVSGRAWLGLAALAGLAFVLVYRFSGLAEFQSGRFVALGNSPAEIVLSPILRPGEFWGKIFRPRTLIFLSALLSPFYVPALARNFWVVLSVIVPLGVLVVWDHLPAQSLAFQYPSGLLPGLWLAAISGSLCKSMGNEPVVDSESEASSGSPPQRGSLAYGCGALTTGLVLGLFLGQFPWSSPTLEDVIARTYGVSPELTRGSGTPDGIWLTKIVADNRRKGKPILATGRIAAHLVGCQEVETVGQFVQRRDKLALLSTAGQSPIRRYSTIIIDRHEAYQQTPEETQQIQSEALASGFVIEQSEHNIVILRSP